MCTPQPCSTADELEISVNSGRRWFKQTDVDGGRRKAGSARPSARTGEAAA